MHRKKAKKTQGGRLLNLKEVVATYGATLWWWRTQVWDGRLPVVQVAKKQLIDTRDIEQFLEEHKVRAREVKS